MKQGPEVKIYGENRIFEDIRDNNLQELETYTNKLGNLDLILSCETILGPFHGSFELNALEAAVVSGHLVMVNSLSEYINPGLNKSFSLTLAAGFGHIEIFNFLLKQKGVDPSNPGYQGETNEALCWAIANADKRPQCHAIVISLLSLPNLNPEACFSRALRTAMTFGQTTIVKLLEALRTVESHIARGVNLKFALMEESDDIVKALYIKYKRDGKDPYKELNPELINALDDLIAGKNESSNRFQMHWALDDYLYKKKDDSSFKPVLNRNSTPETTDEPSIADMDEEESRKSRFRLYRQIV